MSSHYFYGEIHLESQERAQKLCDIVDYENISKLYKNVPPEKRRHSSIPSIFEEGHPEYCQFEMCVNEGNLVKIAINATFELTEEEELNNLGRFLSSFGAEKGILAYYYSGADFTPEFYNYFGGEFSLVYSFGEDQNTDNKILDEGANSLEETFENIRKHNINLESIPKNPEEHYYEKLVEIIKKQGPPILFDSTPIHELETDQYLANRIRDKLIEKLEFLDRDGRKLLQEYIHEVHNSAIKMCLESFYKCNCEIRINGVDISNKGKNRIGVHFS
ncbi:hypothetical protein ACJJI5_03430 [Microbulbifer sp. EKSA008]|uniref:hypothetical protein n=1 Tax=unclassified Microbulbifer TaxID=2619833 RepID=UPI0039B4C419